MAVLRHRKNAYSIQHTACNSSAQLQICCGTVWHCGIVFCQRSAIDRRRFKSRFKIQGLDICHQLRATCLSFGNRTCMQTELTYSSSLQMRLLFFGGAQGTIISCRSRGRIDIARTPAQITFASRHRRRQRRRLAPCARYQRVRDIKALGFRRVPRVRHAVRG